MLIISKRQWGVLKRQKRSGGIGQENKKSLRLGEMFNGGAIVRDSNLKPKSW